MSQAVGDFRIVCRKPRVDKVFELEDNLTMLGTDMSGCPSINIAQIKERYALLVHRDDGHLIERVGSTNVTLVNGIPLTSSQRLSPGDVITLGEKISLVYRAPVLSTANSREELEKRATQLIEGFIEPNDVTEAELQDLLIALAKQQSTTEGFAIFTNIDIPEIDSSYLDHTAAGE